MIFSYTLAFDAPVRGGSEYSHTVWYRQNENAVEPTRRRKIFKDVCILFDRIPACDGQTDGQTSCDSRVRAMHSIAR